MGSDLIAEILSVNKESTNDPVAKEDDDRRRVRCVARSQ